MSKEDRIANIQRGWGEWQDKLESIEVVRDLSEAKTSEVLGEENLVWCREQLQSGTTWDELRRKLNLGPAHSDYRWRRLRQTLATFIVPTTDEEALLASYDETLHLTDRLEKFLEKISRRGQAAEGQKEEHNFLRIELEALKALAERQEKRLEHYFVMKKLIKEEQKNRGPSIIFQNAFVIPRPGDDLKQVAKMAQMLPEGDDE